MGRQKKDQPNNNNEAESAGNFTWTDDEIELLLGVLIHFKAEKEAEGYDWESVKTKYETITELFVKGYPKESNEKFPKIDSQKEFSKARIVGKIKGLRLKYRRAVDAGKRSGGGRVVATFFDMCEKIWGGCPAAKNIEGGLESSLSATEEIEEGDEGISDPGNNDDQANEQTSKANKRRSLVDHLKEQRNSKLMKKVPAEKQLLDVAKEELAVKKDLLTQMTVTDKEQSDQLRALNETMLNLTRSISNGMASLESAFASGASQFQNYQVGYHPRQPQLLETNVGPDN